MLISVAGIRASRQWTMKIRGFSQTHQSGGSWVSASLSGEREIDWLEPWAWLAMATAVFIYFLLQIA